MTRYLSILLFSFVAIAAVPAAQQPSSEAPPPSTGAPDDQPAVTFRVEVNYVEVDVAVFDKQGKFVGDLRREDFRILEDGVEQDITTYSLVSIPVERNVEQQPLFATQPIPPDVATNSKPFEGRLYVIVLDDLHTAPWRTPRVRAAAKQFVERYMADNDLAAVVHTGGRTTAGQEFTNRKDLLLAAIDRFSGRKIRSATAERLADFQRQRAVPFNEQITRLNDALEPERGRNALNTLDVLRAITEWVGGIRGRRKAILFLSEGIDYDIYDFQKRDASSIQDRMREIFSAAARSNVSIYAVDPRGLTSLGDETIEVTGDFPEDPLLNLKPTTFVDEMRLGQNNLRSLAEDTGGFAAIDTNSFDNAWQRVVEDNSHYYVLGYYSSNDRRDGRFRRIEVQVLGREGLEVRARKGYTAPRGKAKEDDPPPANDKTSPELREALDSPIPLPGITLRAFAAPFRGEKPNASVVVGIEAEGADLQFDNRDGKFVNDLEISVIAIDASGKVRGGDRSLLNMGLRPETRERVVTGGVRSHSRISLAPGRYQLRVAARESGAGRIGTVNYDFEVPDFSKRALGMSGVVLTSLSARQIVTVKPDAELEKLLPAPPTALREFVPGDALAFFVEIYDNVPTPAHVVDIKTSVLTDDGRVLFATSDERSSTELQGKPGGYGHTAQIPLRNFDPGLYVLQIEASRRGDKEPPTIQQIPFRVRQPS
ncbi:MAG TPA: VWA domain-containing protein [Vicinamibacterales bacterium]|nr:VWA domain-containing protein [Vicinamibacterales bacterium]